MMQHDIETSALRAARRVSRPEPRAARRRHGPLYRTAASIMARSDRHNLSLIAAGIAFFAMTAIFPAIAAFVSIYGLFADPATIPQQIAAFAELLPVDSMKLLTDALQSFARKSTTALNAALLISTGLALWSAKAGVTALMTGLNVANETGEKRSFIVQQAIAFALTLGTGLFVIVVIAAVALVPAIIDYLPLPPEMRTAIGIGRWPLLGALVCFGLALLYRFGPSRYQPKWRWITWGAAIAAILWLASSAAFSFYVSRFGTYDAMYGSLAAPVLLLLWFWISALVVLLGAEIDFELRRGKE